MAVPSHYPLSLGQIFSLGWSLFRYAWRPIIGASAICLVPAYALMTGITAVFSPLVNSWLAQAQAAQLSGQAAPPFPDGFGVAFMTLFGAGLVLMLGSLLATAAIVRIIDFSYRGLPIGAFDAVRDALGTIVALVGATLLYFVAAFLVVFIGFTVAASLFVGGGIASFFGMVALVGTVAALIFIAMRTSLIAPVVVVDRSGSADSLVRSWKLTSGSGWRVLGYLILVAVISTAVGLLLTVAMALLFRLSDTASMDVAIATAIDGLLAIVVAALAPMIVTLLYYDLRWRGGETVPVPGGGETSANSPTGT